MNPAVVVLVVEDDHLIQDVLEDALREGGFEVRKAFTADEAFRMLDAPNNESFRALISDINLGSAKTGWDVARHARELLPLLPVIYTTTAGSEEWAVNGVPHSILVAKPFATAQVIAAVSQLMNATPAVPAS